MKKYTIALIALTAIGYITNTAANQVTVTTFEDVFVTLNSYPPLSQPPRTTSKPYQGPITRIQIQFQNPARAGDRWIWDWNKYNSIIRAQKADFLKAHPNFPNDVTNIEVSTFPLFYMSGPGYTKEVFKINCWTKGAIEQQECPEDHIIH